MPKLYEILKDGFTLNFKGYFGEHEKSYRKIFFQ